MKAPLFGRIAVLGTGLIGGSLAAAITQHNIACHVAAYDVSHAALKFLEAAHHTHSVHASVAEAVKEADLVVLAVPPDALATLVASIAPHLKKGCIVTDVTSIKRQAIASITSHLPKQVHFVPGHPIAGSEKSGAEAANAQIFEGKRVVLTPSETDVLSEPVAQVRGMWEAVGAQVEYMPAELHDRIYAYVSHLPQLAAFAAKPCVAAYSDANACAGVQRLAGSNTALWADICLANANFIHEALEEFSMFLSQMNLELSENEGDAPQTTTTDDASALLCAVIALCLVATNLLLEQRTGVHVAHYGGNGFRDMTASAGNQSDSVLEAISAQPKAVAALLKTTLNRLNAIGAALSVGNRESLQKAFAS
jgi:cyclohexadieny/prephenate dehydrogenase